jgi:large conductance mechanosensitive channel
MNKYRDLRARGEEEEPEAPPDDVLLLQEIRDLLRSQQGLPPTAAAPTNAPRT